MRRLMMLGVMLLLWGANAYGWTVLKGNLSYASLFGRVPLSDPYHVVQMLFALEAPAKDALIGGLVVFLFYALIAGRAFCAWLCPVNLVTDSAAWLRRKLGMQGGWDMSRGVRYWALGLGLVLSALLGVAAFEWVSPVSMLHRGLVFGMGLGWAAVLGIFVFDLLAVQNGFCGHVCPLGGFYSLAGRFSLIKPVYVHERCSGCNECLKVCPEGQVLGMVGRGTARVSSGECTNCGRCVEVCADGAINFGIGTK